MSQPPRAGGSNYYRDTATAGGTYPNDRPVGLIVMCFSVVFTVLGFMALSAAGTAGAARGHAGGPAFVAGLVIVALSALSVASGYGVMKSQRWAFVLGTIINAISATLLLVLGIKEELALGVAIFYAVYCLLRLSGVGPRPA